MVLIGTDIMLPDTRLPQSTYPRHHDLIIWLQMNRVQLC